MRGAVVPERNQRRPSQKRFTVDHHDCHASIYLMGIVDRNLISGSTIPEGDLETRPCFWYAGIEKQHRSLQAKSQYPFEAHPIHPAGGAGVPSPAPAPDMRSRGVNVGADDIRLDLVAIGILWSGGPVDRVQQREQLGGLVPVAEHREGEYRPDGGMGVLPAVFPNT